MSQAPIYLLIKIGLPPDSQLDQESIVASNAASVSELLQPVVGLHISQQRGAGGISNPYMNGADLNFTSVLLNGIQLNDPTNTHGGSFDFSDLDINSIERIEIIRGPQSAVYGSDALAGAINIITRFGETRSDNSLHFSLGSSGQHAYGYQFETSVSRDSGIGLSIGRLDSGELVTGNAYQSKNLNGRYYTNIGSSKTRLEASWHYLIADRNAYPQDAGGPLLALTDDLDIGEKDDRALGVKVIHHFSDNWALDISSQWFSHREKNDSPGIFPYNFIPPNGSDKDFTRKNWLVNNRIVVNDAFNISLGADLRQEIGRSEGYLDFSGFTLPTRFSIDRDIRGLFTEAQYRKGAWILNAGIRHDSGDTFSREMTGKVALAYQLNQAARINIFWGEGFKLPSFFALADSLTGNPDLRPEKSRNFTIGLTRQHSNYAWNINYFQREYTDLVDFDALLFRHVNRSSVKAEGVDLQLNWDYRERLKMTAFVSYTKVDLVGSSEPDRGFPEWKAGVNSRFAVAPKWNMNLDYLWVDTVYESSLVTGLVPLDAYSKLDVSLNWNYSKT